MDVDRERKVNCLLLGYSPAKERHSSGTDMNERSLPNKHFVQQYAECPVVDAERVAFSE